MIRSPDPETLLRDEQLVAAVIDADRIFGLLKRSFSLPSAFAALVRKRDGSQQVYPAGATVSGDDARELVIVRAQPMETENHAHSVAAKDGFLCDATVRAQVRVLPERREVESFCENVLGSNSRIEAEAVARYFASAVDAAIRAAASACSADELVDRVSNAEVASAVQDALRPLCFAGGMELLAAPRVRFDSQAFTDARRAQLRAEQSMRDHEANRQLQQAIASAQTARLAHLESLLDRLKTLADQSPEVQFPQLMRAFDETQRGELYQALFKSGANLKTTRWIVVVAGSQLMFFDPNSPAAVARTLNIEGPAGPLRSMQIAQDGAETVLMIGAANGAYEMPIDGSSPSRTYLYAAAGEVRGGVNSLAVRGDVVVASHSERGLTRWIRGSDSAPLSLLADMTAGARTVRGAQFASDRLWCSIDDRVVNLPADDLLAKPKVLSGSRSTISALCVCGDEVYAGNADGELLYWSVGTHDLPRRLHAGSRRAVESIVLMNFGGVERLFFTDTTVAVFARVLGDAFTCRFEAGGQTLRRVEVAPDWVVATTDARDRLILWRADQPEHPAAMIPIAQLTGRSIQDVCLVPAPAKDSAASTA